LAGEAESFDFFDFGFIFGSGYVAAEVAHFWPFWSKKNKKS
jgi:hypothetical protein